MGFFGSPSQDSWALRAADHVPLFTCRWALAAGYRKLTPSLAEHFFKKRAETCFSSFDRFAAVASASPGRDLLRVSRKKRRHLSSGQMSPSLIGFCFYH